MAGILEKLKRWLGLRKEEIRDVAEGGISVTAGEDVRETSTNATVAGAAGEPYPGNDELT